MVNHVRSGSVGTDLVQIRLCSVIERRCLPPIYWFSLRKNAASEEAAEDPLLSLLLTRCFPSVVCLLRSNRVLCISRTGLFQLPHTRLCSRRVSFGALSPVLQAPRRKLLGRRVRGCGRCQEFKPPPAFLWSFSSSSQALSSVFKDLQPHLLNVSGSTFL